MKPNAQYGPVGSRILFENNLVRVWEISLEPGEHLLQHYHALPYLVVTIEAAHIRVVEHDGQAYDPTDAPGDVTFREAGQIHELQNISTSRYANRLIEIKQPHSDPALGRWDAQISGRLRPVDHLHWVREQ